MQRHSRLVTPEIRILVEIPVSTLGITFTHIIPVLAMKSLPDFIKRIIVLYVFVRFMQLDRNLSICGHIIFDCEGCTHIRGNLKHILA